MRFLEIKHLAPEHLNSAVELDRLCFDGLWTLEGYRRELDSPNSDLLGLWTWEIEDSESSQNRAGTHHPPPLQIPPTLIGIGCLWAILEEAHIIMLAIHPEFQGRGFGQALLWALLKSACDRQLERSTLEVRESNLAAVALYNKFGFKEAGRRKRYYEDTGEDALVMWRSGMEKPEFKEYLAVEKVQISDRLQRENFTLGDRYF
ncbi:ribosomal protein S18-alanine N-acetyltransferase [Tychonema sp. LEGE 07199]|uniref:ribosomal protein S18-alanine N-acetyltransferase n=1 Tax=unclassified Tychonema TaxID=2642144 RepID=UPI00187E60CE|nr:ribosomal protein S18-alanine N-acetyltransferase [Tychonema sp. LEGE 07199]MBE9131460.1 ribosomal protein S18-alanine N-acetyltransferase [Tychonema sp. LEGE 07196]